MRRQVSAIVVAATCCLPLSFGCSLTRKSAECTETAACREAFGTGFVCAPTGLCELSTAPVSCTAQTPADLLTNPEKYRDYVVIGSLLRAEGKEGARHDAALLAMDAVNECLTEEERPHPALEDLRFGMVQCSHDGSIDDAARLAEYLVDVVGVPVILGPASSSATSAAFTRVNLDDEGNEQRQVVFVSPSATSVALTELENDTPGMLWRTAPTDDGQGLLMGRYAADSEKKFLALYEDTPYGRGLFKQLEAASGELCDECGISFEADSDDVVPLTRTLALDSTLDALQSVETVFFIGAQETHLAVMIERLDSPEFAEKTLFFSDSAASADTVKNAGEHVDRIIGTRPRAADEGEATRFFTAAYEGRYDESPLIHSFTTHAYDATWLMLVSALRARIRGQSITPETIAAGLRSMSFQGWSSLDQDDCPVKRVDDVCPPLTLDESYLKIILKSFEDHESIDVQGASGSLDYDLDTEELANSADAFEFWHLESETSDEITIVGGPSPQP